MQSASCDVIVVGAGVSGLAAAHRLSSAGKRVLILEARNRIGGRILTLDLSSHGPAVELGAEFVHGMPPEIFDCLKETGLKTVELDGEFFFLEEGRLGRSEKLMESVEGFFEKMADPVLPDQSFSHFLEYWKHDKSVKVAAPWLIGYVEGFNAARSDLVSVHSLVRQSKAEAEIDGERQFRIVGGYQRLVEEMFRRLDSSLVTIKLNVAVSRIEWQLHHVAVRAISTETWEAADFSANRLLITVPLGVLQLQPGQDGALEFAPDLPKKRQAMKKIAMGEVIRVALRFRESFWREAANIPNAHGKDLSKMSFVLSQEKPFPTWWTTFPLDSPVLVGWAAGPNAESLRGRSREIILEQAISSLSRVFGLSEDDVQAQLESWHFHNWQTDPFSRGAYSYLMVGGMNAPKELAAPVEGTLFFAGEATENEGHNATVHGAIRTGYRAANEILQSLSSQVPQSPRQDI